MVRNMKETFPPKTGMREKQILQDPGHVKVVGDALLHAACSLQNTCRLPSVRLIIFQLILSNVKDVRDNTTNDNRLHCIALSLFILFHVKDVGDVYNDYELQCKFLFKVFELGQNSN